MPFPLQVYGCFVDMQIWHKEYGLGRENDSFCALFSPCQELFIQQDHVDTMQTQTIL